MMLLGDDFWDAYQGLRKSKLNGVTYDILSDLEESCSIRHQHVTGRDISRVTAEQIEDKLNDFVEFLPGSTGKGADKYYKTQYSNLKKTAATAKEDNTIVALDKENWDKQSQPVKRLGGN